MDYRNYHDNELLDYICEKNEDALEIMYKKYEPLIHKIANHLYKYCSKSGLELSDLVQEGMVGLSKAIEQFQDSKEASFYTFAKMCIERNMISMVVSTTRLKHKILNESISLDFTNDQGESESLDNIINQGSKDPLHMLVDVERENTLIEKAKDILTDFECQVFELKMSDFEYKEIAQILDRNPKAIDNALQRIKLKLKNIVKEQNNE